MGDKRQAESGSRDFTVFRNLRAIELFENPRLFFLGNADSMIGYLNQRRTVFGKQTQTDLPALARILHSVGEQVENRLLDGIAIDRQRRNVIADIQVQHEALLRERMLDRAYGRVDDLRQGRGLQPITFLTALDT